MTVSAVFNDLSEIGGIGVPDADRMSTTLDKDEPLIKTPAAIIYKIYDDDGDGANKVLKQRGWTHLRRTLNWHNWHGGDRPIDLFYKAFPYKTLIGPFDQYRSTGTYPRHNSSLFGCGAGYYEGFPFLNKHIVARNAYLMLFRVLKTQLSSRKLRKFEPINFKCVFQTDTAYYFANGFPPSKWRGKDWERAFWKRTKHYDCARHLDIREY